MNRKNGSFLSVVSSLIDDTTEVFLKYVRVISEQ